MELLILRIDVLGFDVSWQDHLDKSVSEQVGKTIRPLLLWKSMKVLYNLKDYKPALTDMKRNYKDFSVSANLGV